MDFENIGRELECPVCRLIPRCAPIYQCQLGHIVCSECVSQLVTCPVCRTKYPIIKGTDTKFRGRNLIAEKLLETVDRECRYELLGCDFSSHQSSRLVEHESTCEFNPSKTSSAAHHHNGNRDWEGRWKKILFWTFLLLLLGYSLRSLSCTTDETPQGLLVFEAIKNEELEAVKEFINCVGKGSDIRWYKRDENSWDIYVDFVTNKEMKNSYNCLREKYKLVSVTHTWINFEIHVLVTQ